MVVALGLVVWAAVFVCLLAAQAIEADVERRWDEAWMIGWENRRGTSIDELIERLGVAEGMRRQVRKSVGERIVIESKHEILEFPKPPKKEKKKAEESSQ